MWCESCNIETDETVCEKCGSLTEEDISYEVYWCTNCKVPLIKAINGVDKDYCPLCGDKSTHKNEVTYMAQDNEHNISYKDPIIKSISLKNNYDLDLCVRCVRRISEYMELHNDIDKVLTSALLEKTEGQMPRAVELECIKILKHIKYDIEHIQRNISKHEMQNNPFECSEIIEELKYMLATISHATEKLIPEIDY